MKLPVIGGMTQGEGEALGAFTTSGGTCEAVPDLNLSIHGIMLDNGLDPAYTPRTACTLRRTSFAEALLLCKFHAKHAPRRSTVQ